MLHLKDSHQGEPVTRCQGDQLQPTPWSMSSQQLGQWFSTVSKSCLNDISCPVLYINCSPCLVLRHCMLNFLKKYIYVCMDALIYLYDSGFWSSKTLEWGSGLWCQQAIFRCVSDPFLQMYIEFCAKSFRKHFHYLWNYFVLFVEDFHIFGARLCENCCVPGLSIDVLG